MRKLLQSLFLAALIAVPWVGRSQMQNNGYMFLTGTDAGSWVDMTGASTGTTTGDDNGSGLYPIGFTFTFNGQSFTQWSYNTNGQIRLGSTACSGTPYSTPFSTSNIGENTPKVVVLGCDGYIVSGTHYVKYKVITSGTDSTLVIEYCNGPFNSTYRNGLFCVQVRLSQSDNGITMQFSPTAPATPPSAATYQLGVASSATDAVLFNASTHEATFISSGSTTANASSTYPNPGRYYRLTQDTSLCLAPTVAVSNIGADAATVRWSNVRWSAEYVTVRVPATGYTQDFYTEDSVRLTGLPPATLCTVEVGAKCSDNDSVEIWNTAQFRTLCPEVMPIPYTENFDSYAPGSGNFPPCWHIVHRYSTYPYVLANATYSHSLPNSLYFYNSASAFNFITTPAFEVPTGGLYVKYALRSTSSASNSRVVQAGIIGNLTDTGSFLLLRSDTLSTESGFVEPFFYFDSASYEGDTVYVAFRVKGVGTTTGYVYLDDVEVLPMPACRRVTDIVASNITSSSATLTWRDYSAAGDYQVAYGTSSNLAGATVVTDIVDTTYRIGGLAMGMTYHTWVRSVCGDTVTDWTQGPAVTLDCGLIDSTYMLDFVGMTTGTGTLPNCWTRAIGSTSDIYVYSSVAPSVYTHGNDNSLRFYATNGSEKMVVSPRLAIPAGEVHASFWIYSANTYTRFEAGFVTDIDNPDSTFIPMLTHRGVANPMREYEFYSDSLASMTDTVWFALRLVADGGAAYAYIDDILIEHASSCRRPNNLAVQAVDYNTATITWSPFSTLNDNNFEVRYGTSNNPEAADVVTAMVSFDSTITLTGLSPLTTYNVWVRTLCDDNSVTAWRQTSFTTARACADLTVTPAPGFREVAFTITDSQDGQPISSYVFAWRHADSTAWNIDTLDRPVYYVGGLDTNQTIYYYAHAICGTYDGANTATASVTTRSDCSMVGEGETMYTASFAPFYSSNNYSYTQQLYTADEVAFVGDTIRGISLYAVYANSAGRRLRIYLGNTEMQNLNNMTSCLPADSMTLVKNTFNFTYTAGWNTITFDTPFVHAPGSSIVLAVLDSTGSTTSSGTFYVTNTPDAVYNRIFYDNTTCPDPATPGSVGSGASARYRNAVKFVSEGCTVPTCSAPMVTIDSTSTNSISLSWLPVEEGATYTVSYMREYTETWQDTTLTANSLTLRGLQNSSNYTIVVRRNCGVALSSQVEAQTECGPVAVPYVEDFEERVLGYPFDKYCWYNGTVSTDAVSSTNYPYNFYLNGNPNDYLLKLTYGAYVITPTFDVPMYELELYFTYIATGNTCLIVGYLTDDNTSIDSMILLDTIWHNNYIQNDGDSYANVIVPLSGVPANASRLVIASEVVPATTYNNFIGEIVVRRPSICATVSNIVVTGTTTTSATLQWSGNGTGTRYFVEYGRRPLVNGQGTMITTTDTTLALTGLYPSLPYEVSIYAVCANGDTSDMSPVVGFNTDCGPITTVPFTYTFNEYRRAGNNYSGVLPNCWEYDATVTDTTVAGNMPQCYLHTSMTMDAGLLFVTPTYVGLPSITAAPVDTLMLTFTEMVNAGRQDPLVVGMVSSLAGAFSSTFVPIDTLTYDGTTLRYNRKVYLVGYDGTASNIAFHNALADGSTDSSYHLIDNLTITYAPTCIPAQHVVAESVSDVDAFINWRDLRPGSNWQVEYGPRGFAHGAGTMMAVTAHPVHLQNLNPHTDYDVYVRPVCSAGDTAEWSVKCMFTTEICPDQVVITITDSTSGTGNAYLPFSAYYKHGASQQIYRPNEVGSATYISSLSLMCTAPVDGYRGHIYMGNTTIDSLTAWVPLSDLKLVYSGYFDATQTGWREFVLDSAFRYNGTNNLLVMFIADSTNYASNANRYAVHSARMGSSIYYSDDNNAWDNTVTTVNRVAYRNDVRFIGCGGTCVAPVITGIDSTETTLTVHFSREADSVELKVCLGEFDEATPSVFTTDTVYTFTGLAHSSAYVIGVRAICSDDLSSGWVTEDAATVVVTCGVPNALAVQGSTYTSVSVSWTAAGDEQAWEVEIGNTTMAAETYTTRATNYTFDGLTSGVAYSIRVRALCGSNSDIEGEWSEAITAMPDVCQPVSDIIVNVRGTTASVEWTAAENGTGSFRVEYGYNGFSHGEEIASATVNETSYTIRNLDPSTGYDLYVGNICTDALLRWSEPATTFTTGNTGIATVDAEGNLSIYPNPASEQVTLTVSNLLAGGKVSIISIDGREAMTFTLNGNKAVFDAGKLAQGAYFVRIASEQATAVRKLIVK